SLLIRTVPTPRYGTQSNYFPHLAANYFVNNDVQRKKLTGLSLLASDSTEDFHNLFQNFVNTQSLSENFFMFLKLGDILFQERHVKLVYEFAKRGAQEEKIIKSVATNNAIDFFKTSALRTPGVTEKERLVVFALAGSHSAKNFKTVYNRLRGTHYELDTKSSIGTFISKLSEPKQKLARRYLDLLQLSGVENEEF
ncbi:MAG: hypothetical protein KDD61_10345, partial [Bdellovibrionales bacterium]|nr:hypothetical protein [Bdellovibrionales bacterium]